MIGIRKCLVALLTSFMIWVLIVVGRVDGSIGAYTMGSIAIAYITLEVYKQKVLKK